MNDSSRDPSILSNRPSRRARLRREGMTLIEIMIVVVIMAMIATAVAVALMPQLEKARINATRTDAQTIRSAVQLYQLDHHDCPTADKMVEAQILDSGKKTTDAWDNEFQINCDGGNIVVISGGPDGQVGTDDDVQ